ncbi:MAG: NAD-dependent epimerase/dehydratase family protein, partial [Verrucomicrobiota bacterium]
RGWSRCNLVRKISELEAAEVVVFDNLSSAYAWNVPEAANVHFIKGDIRDDEALKRAFKRKPQILFHLAANFANQNSVDNPETDLSVNGMGLLKTLSMAHIAEVERVVYSSSGCGVYGLESKIPFEEHDISISLHTPYQITKLLGELYTNYFHNLYKLPIVNARFFNVFGPGEVPGKYRNVIPNFFFWALSGQPLPITGDGSETRDWTFVGDIVNGLLAMGCLEEAVGEAINLGSGSDTKVIDMAGRVNELSKNEAGIKFVERRNWDVKTRLCSSIDKARRILKYNPETSFDDGLEKVHKWFVDNRELIDRCAEF